MDHPPIADSLERIIFGAVALTTEALAEATPGLELTFPQWRAIIVLGEYGEGARVGEVAARVGGGLPATGRLLRRLERRGLVATGPDPLDGRATRARLTADGTRIRAAIIAFRRSRIEAIVATLSLSAAFGIELARLADEMWRLV